MTKYSPQSLDSLVSAGRTAVRAVQVGAALGNVLAPRGSRRAAFLRAGAKKLKKRLFGTNARARPSASGKKRKRVATPRRVMKPASYQGKVGPAFPRYVKNTGTSKYQRMGYMIEYEAGGATTDANAVYLAHGFPAQVVLEGMCGAITRRALDKFGLQIKGWNIGALTGSSTDTLKWTLQYRNITSGGTANVDSVGSLGSTTALNLVFDLANLLMNTVVASDNFFEPTELRLIWTKKVGTDPTDFREEWRKMAQDIDIDMYFHSVLTMQNRTNSVGGGTDESSVLDVAHNPLKGSIFKGSSTVVNMKSMDNASNNLFINCNKETGFASVAASAANVTVGAKKIPYWSDLTNVYGSTPVSLKAGEIRDSVLHVTKTYKFVRLFKMLMDYMRTGQSSAGGTSEIEVRFPIRIIGLEKKLDTRDANQPAVALGHQINYTLGMVARYKKRNTPLRLIAGV